MVNVVAFILMMCSAVTMLGQGTSRTEVLAHCPHVVSAWDQYYAAYLEGDTAVARKVAKVLQREAPDCDPVRRIAVRDLMDDYRFDEAYDAMRKLYETSRTPLNTLTYAIVIGRYAEYDGSKSDELRKVGRDMAMRAFDMATAQGADKENEQFAQLAMSYGIALGEYTEIQPAMQSLVRNFPQDTTTWIMAAFYNTSRGQYGDAIDNIDRAVAIGVTRPGLLDWKSDIEKEMDRQSHVFGWIPIAAVYVSAGVLVLWIIGMILIRVVGTRYSSRMLEQIGVEGDVLTPSAKELSLRNRYRKLIDIASAYYFFSVPMIVVCTLIVSAAIILAMLAIGYVPYMLLVGVGVVACVTVYATVRAFFLKTGTSDDPGVEVMESDEPELWSVVRQVGRHVDTRPIDEVRFVDDTTVAVYEKGTQKEKNQDMGRRVLLIGTAAMHGMSLGAFRAIIAHEYGHFNNRDTAGGLRARRALEHLDSVLVAYVAANAHKSYNAGWHLLLHYRKILLAISGGASRLQEVLADRVAASLYGADQFRLGLTHVITRSCEMDIVLEEQVHAPVLQQQAIRAMYHTSHVQSERLMVAVNASLASNNGEEDTHPIPQVRFELTSHLAGTQRTDSDAVLLSDIIRSYQDVCEKAAGTMIQRVLEARPVKRLEDMENAL